MAGKGWDVVIVKGKAWPKDIDGKLIETNGLYRVGAVGFDLVDGSWSLVRLKDQVGRQVRLEGMARSKNGEWWFHYKGIDLYVEGMKDLPGWNVENHWRPMVIKGKLEKAKLPRIDQISLKSDRDLKEYYIVREASWEPLKELLAPQLKAVE